MVREVRDIVIVIAIGGFACGCTTREFNAYHSGTTSSFYPAVDTGKKDSRAGGMDF